MPIYEYRCSSCGSRKEHLQKISDPKLTVCPECGKESYEKQLTAAGFQLKGSGWYVTDFRNKDGGAATGKSGTAAPAADAKPAATDAGKDSAGSASSSSESAAAPAPAPTPAAST